MTKLKIFTTTSNTPILIDLDAIEAIEPLNRVFLFHSKYRTNIYHISKNCKIAKKLITELLEIANTDTIALSGLPFCHPEKEA